MAEINNQHAPPPLKYATFVSSRPWTALLIALIFPIILSVIAMPNFSLNDLEGWDVRDGTSSKNYDAFVKAEEVTYGYNKESFSRRRLANAEKQRSVNSGQSLTIYYQDLSKEKNMLRPKGIEFMKYYEEKLLKYDEWLNRCLLVQINNVTDEWSCAKPISIVTGNQSPASTFTEGQLNVQQMNTMLQWIYSTSDILQQTVVNTFDVPTNISSSVRSLFHFGLPIQNYKTSNSDVKNQQNIIQKTYIRDGLAMKAEELLNTIMASTSTQKYQICTLTCDSNIHEFRVMFDYSGLGGGWAMRQLKSDGPLAGLSFLFVLTVMTIHTKSILIASVGMLQILVSFPVTYFFYRVVLNIHHFGTLQVLAVYVILGIGK
jgi:hypothetical protein